MAKDDRKSGPGCGWEGTCQGYGKGCSRCTWSKNRGAGDLANRYRYVPPKTGRETAEKRPPVSAPDAVVRVVDVSLFRFSVVVMVGGIEDCRAPFLEATSGNERAWDGLRAYMREKGLDGGDYLGVSFTTPGFPDAYIHLPKWSASTFVHELLHAVRMSLSTRSVDDEETTAYTLEYVYDQICKDGAIR